MLKIFGNFLYSDGPDGVATEVQFLHLRRLQGLLQIDSSVSSDVILGYVQAPQNLIVDQTFTELDQPRICEDGASDVQNCQKL
jgi:hypothetical protein